MRIVRWLPMQAAILTGWVIIGDFMELLPLIARAIVGDGGGTLYSLLSGPTTTLAVATNQPNSLMHLLSSNNRSQ